MSQAIIFDVEATDKNDAVISYYAKIMCLVICAKL